MGFDYNLWKERHNMCTERVSRFCDLNKDKNSVKCNSTLCVMNNAMQDIQSYFESDNLSVAEFCFLIRNIDVIVTGIMDIYNLLLGVGLRKQDNAIEKCFTDRNIICGFRHLRSLILAHPVDTKYNNESGVEEIEYLEDIQLFNPTTHGFIVKEKCDYVKRMCKPESDLSYFEPLNVEEEIVPVINVIIASLQLLVDNIEKEINVIEKNLCGQSLNLNRETIENYILSLDKELERRYPSAIENTKLENGISRHYSIVYQCKVFFEASFKEITQEKYNVFLDYLREELEKIEHDLQYMQFNEDKYFRLLYDSDLAPGLSYERSKMIYLLNSEGTSYTEKDIGNDTPSNTLWGTRCFTKLIPYIEKFIPVDLTVSDRELYCQYVAAEYLSNI